MGPGAERGIAEERERERESGRERTKGGVRQGFHSVGANGRKRFEMEPKMYVEVVPPPLKIICVTTHKFDWNSMGSASVSVTL